MRVSPQLALSPATRFNLICFFPCCRRLFNFNFLLLCSLIAHVWQYLHFFASPCTLRRKCARQREENGKRASSASKGKDGLDAPSFFLLLILCTKEKIFHISFSMEFLSLSWLRMIIKNIFAYILFMKNKNRIRIWWLQFFCFLVCSYKTISFKNCYSSTVCIIIKM